MKQKRNIYKEVTDQIVRDLEQGAAPWVKPWNATSSGNPFLPFNAVSKANYRGINTVVLMCTQYSKQYDSSCWLTYKQAQSLGGNVRRGERGTMVTLYKKMTRKIVENGEDKLITFPLMRAFTVFNLQQVDGVDIEDNTPPPSDDDEVTRIEKADSIINASNARIEHGGDKACFIPSIDQILMPMQGDFDSDEHYYSTLLHELTHWTGHKARLDRDQSGGFGSKDYAFEELVAELGSAFLCAQTGIQGDLRHSGYIDNWIQLLKSDQKALFKAASLAQKSCEFLNEKVSK